MVPLQAWVEAHRWPSVLRWASSTKPFIFTRRPGFETHVLLLLPSSTDGETDGERPRAVGGAAGVKRLRSVE
jgi:hypothetical protein